MAQCLLERGSADGQDGCAGGENSPRVAQHWWRHVHVGVWWGTSLVAQPCVCGFQDPRFGFILPVMTKVRPRVSLSPIWFEAPPGFIPSPPTTPSFHPTPPHGPSSPPHPRGPHHPMGPHPLPTHPTVGWVDPTALTPPHHTTLGLIPPHPTPPGLTPPQPIGSPTPTVSSGAVWTALQKRLPWVAGSPAWTRCSCSASRRTTAACSTSGTRRSGRRASAR